MNVGTAKSIAVDWVERHARGETWFQGAYFSGSTVGLPNDVELSVGSDVDIVIITSHNETPMKLGKFIYKGTLLEVTYLSWNQLGSVEEVLGSYHLAGSFRLNTIIADPTGHLDNLQKKVSSHFYERTWVRRRCKNAYQKVENGLKSIDTSAPWYDQVTSWLFPGGVTTHVLLVAALQNPTVRLRYLAARKVLLEYEHQDVYSDLLKLLGCEHFTPECVEGHLNELGRTFDATVAVARTPFFFSTDISAPARQIVIEGSRELIRSGNHREAVFWIVATFARCHKILAADAPLELQRAHAPAFKAIVNDLGIKSSDDLTLRARDVLNYMPKLWETTEEILSANSRIIDK